jgi:hypothetical protein
MDLPAFLLDQWTSRFAVASPPIACNLAGSTGPRWTLGEVAALGDAALDLTDISLGYSSAKEAGRFAKRSPPYTEPIPTGSW